MKLGYGKWGTHLPTYLPTYPPNQPATQRRNWGRVHVSVYLGRGFTKHEEMGPNVSIKHVLIQNIIFSFVLIHRVCVRWVFGTDIYLWSKVFCFVLFCHAERYLSNHAASCCALDIVGKLSMSKGCSLDIVGKLSMSKGCNFDIFGKLSMSKGCSLDIFAKLSTSKGCSLVTQFEIVWSYGVEVIDYLYYHVLNEN